MPPGSRPQSQALGRAVSPALGAGGGVSLTAPGDCIARFLEYRRRRVKEASEPLYDRFYIPQLVFDLAVSQSAVTEVCGYADKATMRELEAIERLLRAEHEHAYYYLLFLELLINAPWDVLDDDDKRYHQNVQALKNLLRLHEEKYEERKVEEVVTKSGRKLYLKVKGGKVIVFGDTYPVKDALKQLGFKWDPVERVWYAPANADINSVMARLAEV